MSLDTWYSKGKTATIRHLNVFYNRAGTGEALFCIHGFPSSSWDFEPVWPSLIQRFDVIANDLIGLGKSAKPRQALSISLQADVIEELAIQKGIQKAHLLGHTIYFDTKHHETFELNIDEFQRFEWD